MTFLGLGIGQTLLLGIASGAAVVLLHWLRPRPVEQVVATTIFWPQTAARLRPRYLWHRLYALLSLLLMLLATALLLLAICRPILLAGVKDTAHVIVIESGPTMFAANADQQTGFDVAIAGTRTLLAETDPRLPCAVVVADPLPRLVSHWTTPRAAQIERLRTLSATTTPTDRARTLRFLGELREQMNADAYADTDPTVTWYTNDAAAVQTLLENSTIGASFSVTPVNRQASNGAILWADFVPESSSSTQGVLMARVAWFGEAIAKLSLRVTTADDEDIAVRSLQIEPGAERNVELATLAADGRTLELTLSEPAGSAADNHVTIRLPQRQLLAARVLAQIPAALQIALEAVPVELHPVDAGVFWVSTDRDLSNDEAGTGIVVVTNGPPIDQPLAISATSGPGHDSTLNWDSARCGTGSAVRPREEATPLISAGEHILAALDRTDPAQPRLWLAEALFADDSTAPNVAAFPASIANAVRMLTAFQPPAAVVSTARLASDPAGVLHLHSNQPVTRTVGDRSASRPLASQASTERAPGHAGPGVQTSTVMLVCGMLLIGIEGFLWARGWIR